MPKPKIVTHPEPTNQEMAVLTVVNTGVALVLRNLTDMEFNSFRELLNTGRLYLHNDAGVFMARVANWIEDEEADTGYLASAEDAASVEWRRRINSGLPTCPPIP
jgi:hypothetical protein